MESRRSHSGLSVALVVSHLRGGGKERFVVTLGNSLAGRGARVMVVCLQEAGALAADIRRPEVALVELGKRRGNDAGVILRLARLLRQERVDVVHSNNWGTLVECLVAGALAGGRPVVHTQHGLGYEFTEGALSRAKRPRRTAERVAARRLAEVAAVSAEVRETIVRDWRVAPERVRVIHNGIPVSRRVMAPAERLRARAALGFDTRDLVIGSVGYLRPVKDYPALLRAMVAVRSAVPRAALAIVGDGPMRAELERLRYELGLTECVRFLGIHTDVPALLPLFDMFALASVSEGISLSVLEAMVAGLPVVATRVGGNPEIIGHGETGLLVPPRDPAALAQALVQLASSPELCADFGARGRRRAAGGFSVERMAADYEELYARACR